MQRPMRHILCIQFTKNRPRVIKKDYTLLTKQQTAHQNDTIRHGGGPENSISFCDSLELFVISYFKCIPTTMMWHHITWIYRVLFFVIACLRIYILNSGYGYMVGETNNYKYINSGLMIRSSCLSHVMSWFVFKLHIFSLNIPIGLVQLLILWGHK